MMKNLTRLLTFSFFGILCATTLSAQMPGPFAEEERQQRLAMQQASILTKDSIILYDTARLYDPVTFEETVRIVRSKMSIWEYCTNYLGIPNPDRLLDGQTMTITDPETYDKIKVRWNHNTSKIDTIPQ